MYVLSRLSPQWFCGNSCPWVQDVRLHIGGTNLYIDMTYICLIYMLYMIYI